MWRETRWSYISGKHTNIIYKLVKSKMRRGGAVTPHTSLLWHPESPQGESVPVHTDQTVQTFGSKCPQIGVPNKLNMHLAFSLFFFSFLFFFITQPSLAASCGVLTGLVWPDLETRGLLTGVFCLVEAPTPSSQLSHLLVSVVRSPVLFVLHWPSKHGGVYNIRQKLLEP